MEISNELIKILVILNGWNTKISGGDSHILGVAKQWMNTTHIALLMPKLGYELVPKELVHKFCKYSFVTPFEHEKRMNRLDNIVLAYIFRIFKSSIQSFDIKYDLIISSSHFLYDVVPAVILRRKMKSKLVVYVHHLVSSHKRKGNIKRFLSIINEIISLWFIRKYADIIFTVNDVVKSELVKMGFCQDNLFVTSNGIDIGCIKNIYDITEKKYDACFIGRLVTQKGIFDLVYVWAEICKHNSSAKLAIIGEGPKHSELVKIIQKNKLESNIDLLGFLSEKEKIEILKSTKIFVFPSYEEGWGIAICEAMACVLPVVAYNLPAYKNVFKIGMVTVPIGDIKALTKQTENLLKDESLRVTMGKKAEIQANEYDINNIARDELSIIIKEFNWVI